MKRGDLVTIALQGDYGKPHPALIVQSDFMCELESVVVCPITSTLRDASAFRVTLEPTPANGLKNLSQIMTDKLSTVAKSKVGSTLGRLDDKKMQDVERALLLVLGIA